MNESHDLRDALLWERESSCVRCRLCPWYCLIGEGKRGVCHVRINKGDSLYTLIYGKVAAAAADPIEKKPLFHFFPGTKVFSLGTFGCNMQCGHCQNWQIAHVSPDVADDRLRDIDAESAVRMALDQDCQGIAWTYNEPTIWFEYTLDSAALAREAGLYTVYVTNGYITEEALDLIGPHLEAFRVDIKAFNDEAYGELTKIHDFQPILDATVYAKTRWQMHVEIVTNVIPGLNDDDDQLMKIAAWIADNLGVDTPWHVTRFFPYLDLANRQPTPVETLMRAQAIGNDNGLNYVYIGNVHSPLGETTVCPACGEVAVSRRGYALEKFDVKEGRHLACGQDLNITESLRSFEGVEKGRA